MFYIYLQVKKIMNTVYKEMRDTFKAEESYSGSQILQAILASIKVRHCQCLLDSFVNLY